MNRLTIFSRAFAIGAAAFFLMQSSSVSAKDVIQYTTLQGDEIKAVYIPAPDTAAKPAPAIIMLHGCGGLYTKKGEIRSRERLSLIHI